jgi:hypothetical protein
VLVENDPKRKYDPQSPLSRRRRNRFGNSGGPTGTIVLSEFC